MKRVFSRLVESVRCAERTPQRGVPTYWLPWLILILCSVFTSSLSAHEVRPAYLEMRQVTPDTYDVLWKVPALGDDRRLGIYVRFPSAAKELSERRGFFSGNAYVERSRIQLAGGLDGQTIHIDGLAATKIDVLARVERLGGVTQTVRILPDAPSFLVEATPSAGKVSLTYLKLGVEHILLGIDHLLFVLALVLLVKGWKKLAVTITTFTVAHSITLAAATLGFVHVPGLPVEACIALSIVFVAAEILRNRSAAVCAAPAAAASTSKSSGWVSDHSRAPSFTERAPWVVAFTFGLLHGLGFAGALSEVGLPQQAIPLALLFFNVGVELGQLAFIAVVLGLATAIRHLPVRTPTWGWRVMPYAIGSVAIFWVIQRTTAF